MGGVFRAVCFLERRAIIVVTVVVVVTWWPAGYISVMFAMISLHHSIITINPPAPAFVSGNTIHIVKDDGRRERATPKPCIQVCPNVESEIRAREPRVC